MSRESPEASGEESPDARNSMLKWLSDAVETADVSPPLQTPAPAFGRGRGRGGRGRGQSESMRESSTCAPSSQSSPRGRGMGVGGVGGVGGGGALSPSALVSPIGRGRGRGRGAAESRFTEMAVDKPGRGRGFPTRVTFDATPYHAKQTQPQALPSPIGVQSAPTPILKHGIDRWRTPSPPPDLEWDAHRVDSRGETLDEELRHDRHTERTNQMAELSSGRGRGRGRGSGDASPGRGRGRGRGSPSALSSPLSPTSRPWTRRLSAPPVFGQERKGRPPPPPPQLPPSLG